MCGIYGVLSYKGKLKDINALTKVLAIESADRGTDATGVAYVAYNSIKVHKRPISAYKFNPEVPMSSNAVIGHTRHSTQGDKSHNYNNHPWMERVSNCSFALAHNGVLLNDHILQKKYGFKSKIQTDSYVAVQLLKMQNRLDMQTLKFMAESIDGSFSFNLLDSNNTLYLIKGDSPICLLHFKSKGVYVYASTSAILWRAIIESELFGDLQKGSYEQIGINEGEILKISKNGKLSRSRFKYETSFYAKHWWEYPSVGHADEINYIKEIKSAATGLGISAEMIDDMYEKGYSPFEIEEYLFM